MPRDATVNHMTSPPFTAAGTLDHVYPLAQWRCGNFRLAIQSDQPL